MSSIDKILEVLDVGAQSSSEMGCGTDLDPELCARCQVHRAGPAGSDMCLLCRDFLLGDSERDPAVTLPSWVRAVLEAVLDGPPDAVPDAVWVINMPRQHARSALVIIDDPVSDVLYDANDEIDALRLAFAAARIHARPIDPGITGS